MLDNAIIGYGRFKMKWKATDELNIQSPYLLVSCHDGLLFNLKIRKMIVFDVMKVDLSNCELEDSLEDNLTYVSLSILDKYLEDDNNYETLRDFNQDESFEDYGLYKTVKHEYLHESLANEDESLEDKDL